MAGLLTYSHFDQPSHILKCSGKRLDCNTLKEFESAKMLHGTYSNGLAQDLHLIPSSSTTFEKMQPNHCGGKCKTTRTLKKIKNSFY
ncbi:hypothetical protein ASF10_11265 [Flavobacterium sp. Leaf82]|nr:hypothetical protein ASF10_11265 [Flavobacterium sp. Leaf82]